MFEQVRREFFADMVFAGDSEISIAEIEALLESIPMGFRLTDKEIRDSFEELGPNINGKVDVEQFLNTIKNATKREAIYRGLVERSDVRKAFEKYDRDGNGYISRDEFNAVVRDKYQAKLTNTQIQQMMKTVDINEDGKIEYDEFCRAFRYFPATH